MSEYLKTVAVPSLASGKEILAVSRLKVIELAEAQLPIINDVAFAWIDKRPLLKIPGDYTQTDYLDQSGIISTQRIRELITLSQSEVVELLESVRSQKPPKEIQLEFGDTVFPLLLFTDISDLRPGEEELSPKAQALFPNLTGEECLVSAINGLAQAHIDPHGIYSNLLLKDCIDEHFQTLIDNSPTDKALALVLNTALRYALINDWDLVKIITNTSQKNDQTMPAEFFGPFSPFPSADESIIALRLLRKYVFTDRTNSFTQLYGARFYENKGWGSYHPDGYDFRLWVNEQLEQIVGEENLITSDIDKHVARQLLEVSIISERPLWKGSKHSFMPYSLENYGSSEYETSPNQF